MNQTGPVTSASAWEAEQGADFWRTLILVALLLLPLLMVLRFPDYYNFEARLARGFLQGHLYFNDSDIGDKTDIVMWNGNYTLPYGPFSSLIEIPVVALIGPQYTTVLMQFALTLVNVWLLWQWLCLLLLAGEAQRWITMLFFIGALYVQVANKPGMWFMMQVLCVTLLLAALILAEQGRWLLVGLLLGSAIGTRFTMVIDVLYFVILIWFTTPAMPQRRRHLLGLGLGLLGPVMITLGYNYIRFGNILETGYAKSINNNYLATDQRGSGLFNLSNIPTNFYYMFLKGVDEYPNASASSLQFPWIQPSRRGMGIFFTTPALTYIFRVPLNDNRVKAALPTVLLGVSVLLTYYYTGYPQFGYRYLLDFMPLIFILLIASLRRLQGCAAGETLSQLPRTFKILAAVSIVIGLWGIMWTSFVISTAS